MKRFYHRHAAFATERCLGKRKLTLTYTYRGLIFPAPKNTFASECDNCSYALI